MSQSEVIISLQVYSGRPQEQKQNPSNCNIARAMCVKRAQWEGTAGRDGGQSLKVFSRTSQEMSLLSMTMIKQQIIFFLSSLQCISGSVLNVPFSSPLLVIFHFPARVPGKWV